jgi:hypothetical protein
MVRLRYQDCVHEVAVGHAGRGQEARGPKWKHLLLASHSLIRLALQAKWLHADIPSLADAVHIGLEGIVSALPATNFMLDVGRHFKGPGASANGVGCAHYTLSTHAETCHYVT